MPPPRWDLLARLWRSEALGFNGGACWQVHPARQVLPLTFSVAPTEQSLGGNVEVVRTRIRVFQHQSLMLFALSAVVPANYPPFSPSLLSQAS